MSTTEKDCTTCDVGKQTNSQRSECVDVAFPIEQTSPPRQVSIRIDDTLSMKISWQFPEIVVGSDKSFYVYHVQLSSNNEFSATTAIVDLYTADIVSLQMKTLVPDFMDNVESLWNTVVFARVRVFSTKNKVGGEWSSPTNPWTITSDCRAQDQYLNNTGINPSEFVCVDCHPGAVCDATSTARKPVVKQGWWRHKPESSDLQKYPYYRCPGNGTCAGGNATKGRCSSGYNDSPNFDDVHGYLNGEGPLCTTCAENYVRRGKICVSCQDTPANSRRVSQEMFWLIVGLASVFFLGLVGYYYMDYADKECCTSSSADIVVEKVDPIIDSGDLEAAADEKQQQENKCNNSVLPGVQTNADLFSNCSHINKFYAIYIGIDGYKYMNKLFGCERDAKDMEKQLAAQHNYETIEILLGKNATYKSVMSSFETAASKIGKDDQLLVFMAGELYLLLLCLLFCSL